MFASLSPGQYAEGLCAQPDAGSVYTAEEFEQLAQPLCDAAQRVVIQKAAQVGATVMAVLRAIYAVDWLDANTMYLFPTHRSAGRFQRGRFHAMLEQSPYHRDLFTAVNSGGHLRAGTANFYCHGARSRVEVMSTPVRYLTLDERDELYQGDPLGRQPWSAVDLARQRLRGQAHSWELNISTPTIPGRGVHAEFADSDQHEFHPRCPRCVRYVLPAWPEAIVWRQGRAAFACPRCRLVWSHDDRRLAIRDGAWVPQHPGRSLRGYHLTQLTAANASAEDILRDWKHAQDRPLGKQVFFNAVLGLPYLAEGARLERRCLDAAMLRGGQPMAHGSPGSVMGVDVGPTWLHAVALEPDHPCPRLIWADKLPDWPALAETMRRFRVESFVVDAMPETHEARSLVRRFSGGWLCYYRGGPTSHADQQTRVLQVPRTETLDAMYQHWRTGTIASFAPLPAEFIDQLTGPVRVMRIGGDGQARADYQSGGGPDHFAHAMNYAVLALNLRPAPLRFEVTPPVH